jgi:hypothetical protein
VRPDPLDIRSELERVKRVSDMMCTAHAGLRDRFSRRALILDLAVLGGSSWLVALTFVQPRINLALTPFGLDPQLWIGLLAIFTFFLSVAEIKVDWKGRSDAHKRSVTIYAEVHRRAGYLLAETILTERDCSQLLTRFDLAALVGTEIPERAFLRQKRRHRTKISVSRYLDTHPSASIHLTRIKFWFRDNFRGGERQ